MWLILNILSILSLNILLNVWKIFKWRMVVNTNPLGKGITKIMIDMAWGSHRRQWLKRLWQRRLCRKAVELYKLAGWCSKEVGHVWTGYSYILFFVRSGAIFAWLLNRIPVHHKWGQHFFQCPKCPYRAPQNLPFSLFLGVFKYTYTTQPKRKKFISRPPLGPWMP